MPYQQAAANFIEEQNHKQPEKITASIDAPRRLTMLLDQDGCLGAYNLAAYRFLGCEPLFGLRTAPEWG